MVLKRIAFDRKKWIAADCTKWIAVDCTKRIAVDCMKWIAAKAQSRDIAFGRGKGTQALYDVIAAHAASEASVSANMTVIRTLSELEMPSPPTLG